METEESKALAATSIDRHKDEFVRLSNEIWKNPELDLEEHFAHRVLTDYLEEQGFVVERSYGGMKTAFRARFGSGRPNVCVICEYDALPGIGHACGHNLIAEAGVAAGMGVKAVLEGGAVEGQVTVLGTPGEEGSGGKIYLAEYGAFRDIDTAIMVHPSNENILMPKYDAMFAVEVSYYGTASHAAEYPWKGDNALDAAVMAYTSLSSLRQQLPTTWQLHGVIVNGGASPEIIPEKSVMQYYFRAPTMDELAVLKQKSLACFEGAASATSCVVEVKQLGKKYDNLVSNKLLVQRYKQHCCGSLGISNIKDTIGTKDPMGSSDIGNVSHIVPTVHAEYKIGSGENCHTPEFTSVTNTEDSHSRTLTVAKAMAFTCIDVLHDKNLLRKVVEEFTANSH